MTSPAGVSQEGQAAIRSLIPSSAVDWAIRPRSRDPGLLSWRQTVVQEAAAQRLLGFAPPVLPSLRGDAVVEYLSFHEGLPSAAAAGAVSSSGDVRFRASYLPVGLPWSRATRASVLDGATLLTWSAEHRDSGGRESEWPQRIASSKADRGHEGSQLEKDFTVVEVGEVRVGVQAGESGLVCLMWRVRCAGTWCRASVMTQRDPMAAVQLVVGDGLLRVR